MLLTIDVGNTNTVFGLFDGDNLLRSWRLSTLRGRTIDECGVLVRNLFALDGYDVHAVRAVIVASVVPPLDPTIQGMVERYFSTEAVFVTSANAGITVLYDTPRDVGADRIVDAVAALDRYGAPAIVVDLGTATTFDAITRDGEYGGGLIAPGIEVSASALIERAAKLPRIDIRKPDTLIGRTTVDSLQSGFFWGYVSLVDGILDRMKRELGDDAIVIATGGMAHFVRDELRHPTELDVDLTLRGLRLVAAQLGVG